MWVSWLSHFSCMRTRKTTHARAIQWHWFAREGIVFALNQASGIENAGVNASVRFWLCVSSKYRLLDKPIISDAYPKIIHFPESELLLHGDKKRTASLQVTCRATGQQPLSYKWLLSNKNTAFKTKEYLTGDKGDLFIQIPLYRDPYQAVCVVSNKYGTVFSNPRQVEIAGKTCLDSKITMIHCVV